MQVDLRRLFLPMLRAADGTEAGYGVEETNVTERSGRLLCSLLAKMHSGHILDCSLPMLKVADVR